MSGHIHRKLSEFDIRPTKQRMQLVSLLFSNGEPRHFTAETLFDEAKAEGYSISLATIYNTLHVFCHAGLIREIAIEGHRSFYDTKTSGHPHYYDERTGKLFDAPEDAVKVELCKAPPEGTEVKAVDIVIRIAPKSRDH